MNMKLVTAKWCSPCKILKAQLSAEGIEIETIDADDNMSMLREMGIKSVPTLIDDNQIITSDILNYIKNK